MRFAPVRVALRLAGRLASQLVGAPRWLVGLLIISVFLLHPLVLARETDLAKKTSFLSKLEAIAYDTRLRLTLPRRGDPQVVIIDIDEGSLHREGQWPWSRDKLARLVTQLLDRYQVRAVGFDVLFSEPDRSSGIPVLEELARSDLKNDRRYRETIENLAAKLDFDARFATAMRGRPVLLPFGFTVEQQAVGALPPPLFTRTDLGSGKIKILPEHGYTANLPQLVEASAGGGHIDPVFDSDNIIRRVPMVKLFRDAYFPALSLAIVQNVLEAKRVVPKFDGEGTLEALDVGGLEVPVAEDGTALIPFRGPSGTFRYYSAADVLAGGLAVSEFPGAIALVGTTAKGLKDLRPTPLGPDFAGVEIHASLISGMLNEDLRAVPAGANDLEALVMVVAGLVVLFAIPYRRPLVNAAGVIAVIAVLVGLNLALWIQWRQALPVAATVAMLLVLFTWNMVAGFAREARAIRKLSDMFGEYVPRERVAQMRESGRRFSMAGESRKLTVLFSDVRNFTALSENLAPPELSAMMNAYLTPMTAIIHDQHGTVDKYVGDLIMAFWGAPVDNPQHAQDAVAAALAMQQRMLKLAQEFRARRWPELSIGIGINTGTMNVGDMGSKFRKAYTVLGDAVNLASRIEGLTKEYGVDIIVGEDTRRAVPNMVYREIDVVRVKGKAKPVSIYQPLGTRVSKEHSDELERYARALAAYRQRRFEDAEAEFVALAAANPALRLYALYRARCAGYRLALPPEGWDGATTFETK